MLARALSAAANSIEVFPVEAEVNSGWGATLIVIVGLPELRGICFFAAPPVLRLRG
jgi:hypothetical protein